MASRHPAAGQLIHSRWLVRATGYSWRMGELAGRTYYRGESGYEAARSAAVKNGRKPDRFPDVIVHASSEPTSSPPYGSPNATD